MNDRETAVAGARARLAAGEAVEGVLAHLRREGCSMATSVLVLADAGGMDLDEARRVVVLSEAWQDHREAHDAVEEAVFGFLDGVGEPQADGTVRIHASDVLRPERDP